jgi:hypothetical protein
VGTGEPIGSRPQQPARRLSVMRITSRSFPASKPANARTMRSCSPTNDWVDHPPINRRKQPMFNISKRSSLAVIIMSLGLVAGTCQLAAAKTWSQTHPRRDEVNDRLENQNLRIDQALKQGKISVGQAEALQDKDAFIRKEERFDARQNGSHITAAEQKSLNQQENSVSGKIP